MLKKNYKVGIIGLGYVGHSLFQSIKKKNISVVGYDISKKKIKELKKNFKYNNIISSESSILKFCNIYLICVPTPVYENKKPDLNPLKTSCETLSKFLKKNDIVIFESTVYPGITRNFCLPILLDGTKTFFYGYSPERYSPGDKRKIEDITKIVSGETFEVAKKIKDFYSLFIKKIHLTKSIEEAEMSKNFENCQRDHNIALMNQLNILCEKNNINVKNIIAACKSKWNFNDYRPGLVGGHCISVDPYYLIEYSKKLNFDFSTLKLSRNVNENFITYTKNKITKFFKFHNLKKKDKILFIGGTYKKDVDDLRNSGALKIFKNLKKKYININLYDPLIKKNKVLEYDKYKVIVVFVLHSIFLKNKKLMNYLKNNKKIVLNITS